MSNLTNYTFYHGTSLSNAEQIVKHGFKISNKIGSLGKGAYAFCESYTDAKYFADKHYHPRVVSFKILNPNKILDFTTPKVVNTFNNFTNASGDEIKHLIHRHSNLGKIKTLDGTTVDYFIDAISRLKKYLGVYNPSQNEVSKQTIPDSRIPNSIELCIKDNSIIDSSTLEIL